MKKLSVILFTILFTVSSVWALTPEEKNTIEVYQKVHKGVVTIKNYRESQGVSGSGAVIKKGGYIITNFHVVADAKKLEVLLNGETMGRSARIVKVNKKADLAIIQVEENIDHIPVLPLGSTDGLMPGQKVIVLGSPYALPGSISVGVCMYRRDLPLSDSDFLQISNFIQHDATTNPGNSGGPVFNSDGEIIAITSFRITSDNAPGISMGIPVEYVKAMLKEMA